MATLHRETQIDAPRERVFDLARHVEAHVATMPDERASGATGLLELGDEITFRQRQFGIPFSLTAEVTEFDRPRRFVDEQISGVFGSLVHEHTFEMPFGPLGQLGQPIARRRLARLIEYHAAELATLAEGDGWRQFLD